ncbi:TatD family hydrolase [Cellulomonas sp. DKR-3]|uniref:TatD family hydrolase n=1 Tax=Cellulomonas fulva TaxID=2835530 RepID=A0ABS5TUZ2_9CELL|nr:TatD family hydrolase [Cellulomonas fulva]MBT0992923.1 TatD family hydrolase [Cellulomonas fulva]
MARTRERGWPATPEPLPVPVVDNHTHLETVVTWRADGWTGPSAPSGTRSGAQSDEQSGAQPELPGLVAHLERAAAAGVPRMVQVGCDVGSVRWTDAVVREHPSLVGAVAVHPNEAVLHAGVREVAPDGLEPDPQEWHAMPLDEALDLVATTARGNPRIRAIGETGLDFFRAGPLGRAVQREAFRAHVALAKELGLALQIHDRDAHDEVVELLLRDGAPERTVFHCFSGDQGLAQVAAEHGWFCSFAGPVSYPANEHLRAAARALPVDLLLVETDAPYLTPHPWRGRPNAPYLLGGTVRALAEARGQDLPELCAALTRTTDQVYGPW